MSISRNSSLFFGMQLASLLSGAVLSIIVARSLGPTLRGVYFIMLASNTLVVSLATLGIPATNKYWLAKGKYTLSEVNTNSLTMASLTGGMILAAYLSFGKNLNEHILRGVDEFYIVVSFLLVPFSLYRLYWEAMMAGLNRFGIISGVSVTTTLVNTILTVVAVLALNAGLNGLVAVWIITSVGGTLVAAHLALQQIRRRGESHRGPSIRLIRESLSFGLRDHAGSLAYHLFTNADSFVVNALLGVTNVGYYGLAKSLAARVVLLPNSLVQASIPRIGSETEQASAQLTSKIVRHSLALATASGVVVLSLSPWAVPLLYGSEFVPAVEPLGVLLPGNALLVMSVTLSAYLTYQLGRPELPAFCSWITLAISVPLCLTLSARFGLGGAAVAVSTTFLAIFLMLFLVFVRLSKQNITSILSPKRDDFTEYTRLGLGTCTRVCDRTRHLCDLLLVARHTRATRNR